MTKKKTTVVCEGNERYYGIMADQKISPLGKLEWVEIITNKSKVKINASYIVSIVSHG